MLYKLLKPIIFKLDPELAHKLSIIALKFSFSTKHKTHNNLSTTVFGINFPNPVGLAAGYDKDGEVPNKLLGLGFGFVEVGTLTPKPQTGNDKPRLFRLAEDRAVINRMGFNNGGQKNAVKRLSKNKKNKVGLLGINIGANKTSEDKNADYATGISNMSSLADYLVVNISSPNTPGLRDLQSDEKLDALLVEIEKARKATSAKPPILVKVAPDLSEQEIAAVSKTILKANVDGLIVSNTTLARPTSLKAKDKAQAGGLSGAPLFLPSTEVLKKFYQHLKGEVPIIGVGGISSAEDAYIKIKSGAALVQLYSGLVYGGPKLVTEIINGLSELLNNDGYNNISEAVGVDVEKPVVTMQNKE